MRQKYCKYAGKTDFIHSMGDPATDTTGMAWCADCDDMESCDCGTLRFLPLRYPRTPSNIYRVKRTSLVVIK